MSDKIRTQVSIAPQAHEDVRVLGAGAKDSVGDFVRRLRADRTSRAIRLAPLRAAGSNGQLSLATLDGGRMALLLETEQHRFTLLAVREGARAHDDLTRLTVTINEVSGGIELVDQAQVSATVVALPERSTASGASHTGRVDRERGGTSGTGGAQDTTAAVNPEADHAQAAQDDAGHAEPSGMGSTGTSTATDVGAPENRTEPAPGQGPPLPLFDQYDEVTLTRLGVIPSLLPSLRRVTDERRLEALLGHNLPQLTREVLRALHAGMDTADVRRHITEQWRAEGNVDPGDWARAARRPVSQVSTEDTAVLGALGDSFEAWRLFLHPEQRRLATTAFKGSAKVTGGPGTGKTVVALHRVRHLVDRLPPGRTRPVLLTTYNTNLAEDLKHRLQPGGEKLLSRVHVVPIDRLAHAVVAEHPTSDLGSPLDDKAALDLWHTVCMEEGVDGYDAEFLDSEFKHVILAQGCGTQDQYFRVERPGRGRLQRPERRQIWSLVQAYRDRLAGPPRRTTHALVADEAARLEQHHMARIAEQQRYKAEQGGRDLLHREAGSGMWLKPRYQHVVVDEAQDLSASHWRMLRAMVPEGPDDIFLVGDAHQRIYSHQVVLGRLGIRTPGRASRRLSLNYRTTHQILGSARGLVDGESFDDLDDGPDTLDGYRSVLTGLAPQFWRAPDWATEKRALATLIQERHDRYGTPYSAMAVCVPDGASATQLAATLGSDPFRIPAVEIGNDGPGKGEGVRIGTMYRFKGLEFQRVFLASVSEGQVPHQRIEGFRHTDPQRYQREHRRARSLLFVAATRARDELVVSWNGRASRFLPESAARGAYSASALVSGERPPSDSHAA